MKKGHIFFFCWVSWAWKGTVIKRLLNEAIPNLEIALSCKTREPRETEILWVDYNKLTLEEFKQSIINWDFLEYNFIHNQAYYGTRIVDVIDNWINKGKIILKEIDILILPKILEEKKIDKKDFTYIFLDIPESEIKQRMINRWDDVTGNDYKNRIISAKKEKKLSYLADYIVDSTWTKKETLKKAKKIILKKIKEL